MTQTSRVAGVVAGFVGIALCVGFVAAQEAPKAPPSVAGKWTLTLVTEQFTATSGLELKLDPNPNFDAYYGLIDFEFWARKNIGEDAVEYLKKNVHPLDLAFRVAETHGIVLLNGGGFQAPEWSLRVSLANLPDEVYDDIGRAVRAVARAYRDAFEASRGARR